MPGDGGFACLLNKLHFLQTNVNPAISAKLDRPRVTTSPDVGKKELPQNTQKAKHQLVDRVSVQTTSLSNSLSPHDRRRRVCRRARGPQREKPRQNAAKSRLLCDRRAPATSAAARGGFAARWRRKEREPTVGSAFRTLTTASNKTARVATTADDKRDGRDKRAGLAASSVKKKINQEYRRACRR